MMRWAVLMFLAVWMWPLSAHAEVVRYINKDLSTGANDGTSSANAYRGVNALERFRAGSGGSTIDRVIFEGSGTYREVFSTVTTRIKTDISFAASTGTITSASSNFTTIGFQTGDIIRVLGSTSNDRQYTVGTVGTTTMTVSSSNIMADESAGESINISAVTRGSNLASLDPGGSASATRFRRWQFNGSTIDSGLTLTAANGYTWTQSTGNPNEWYVRRSDGSNPSLVRPYCGVIGGIFVNDSADLDPDMGTVGSLTGDVPLAGGVSPMGWGDNDSLGYSTVYVRSSVNPESLTVRVGQVPAGISTTWGWHSFEDGIFELGNRNSTSSTGYGVGISHRSSSTWYIKRCLFRYQSLHAIDHSNTGTTEAYSNLSYFSGHRHAALNADGALKIYNSVDYGSHLFAIITSGVTGAGSLTIRNSISAYNEAGAIAKGSATAVLTEDHNIWWPRFGASGGALGYTQTANWTTTDATDYPPSAATTISTQAANSAAGAVDPLFVRPSLTSVQASDFKVAVDSAARYSGAPVFFLRDMSGRRFALSHPSRGIYEFASGDPAGIRTPR